MSEIEKLYELANVQPQYKKRIECKDGHPIGQPCGKSPCIDCDKSVFEDVMPLFTAEKQIKILKLILKKRRILDVGYIIEEEKYHCMHYERVFDSFEEALCADINYHWRDLSEEEKQQVKEILE